MREARRERRDARREKGEAIIVAAPDSETISIPIDGTLDLHAFDPKDVKDLLPEYLEQCRARGILDVHVVHGKGTGAMQRTVHALLARIPNVAVYRLAPPVLGHWGATLVVLAADEAGNGSPKPQ
jgi:DNA-nicking Smr family endonuclease